MSVYSHGIIYLRRLKVVYVHLWGATVLLYLGNVYKNRHARKLRMLTILKP